MFTLLTLARVIEPTSKLDSIRVLSEVGIAAPSYPTIKRRLPVYATPQWRDALASACAAHIGLGPATLVLYDVTRLYFETEGDGFREPGFSKERRLEPQITVGLLTDVHGFPTAGPRVRRQHRRGQDDFAGDPGLHRGARLTGGDGGRRRRDAVGGQLGRDRGCRAQVHRGRPDPRRPLPSEPVAQDASRRADRRRADLHPAVGDGPKTDPRKRTIFYQYRADRAKRTLKGIDQQIAKAEKVVAGQAAVNRNRFVQLTGGTKAVNRDLEDKARALAGLKGYVTNLEAPTAEYVLGAYHQLWADREQLPECPRPIYEPGRSTATNATPSRPTSLS
ncbi:MAG TPA: hypothetical protein VFY56_07560 [Propionibacteriaceae bacterium]|nr:hypothetical protein [Propionibacteriaceae bacterium]